MTKKKLKKFIRPKVKQVKKIKKPAKAKKARLVKVSKPVKKPVVIKVAPKKIEVAEAPLVSAAKKSELSRTKAAALQKLVLKGKKQGFLTQEDILTFFPEAEENILELDDLYSRLLDLGIDVFDNTAIAEAEKVEDESDVKLENLAVDKTVS